MLKIFFSKLKEQRTIANNIISLGMIQIVNTILPLFIIPYLIRVLGSDGFGRLMFVNAVILYIQIIIDYGFNLSGVSYLAPRRDDVKIINRTYSNIFVIRLVMWMISLFVLTFFLYFINSIDKSLYIFSMGSILGSILLSSWFYQSIEKMKYLAVYNFLLRCITLILIVLLINDKNDLYLYPLINSTCYIIIGIVSFITIHKKFSIKIAFPKRKEIIFYLRNGFYLFLSQLQISLFNNTNTIILGVYCGSYQVGVYAATDKIIRALATLQGPITGAIFPRVAKNINENKTNMCRVLTRITLLGVVIYTFIIIILCFFNKEVISTFNGYYNVKLSSMYFIMITIPIAIFMNNIAGTQIMINLGFKKEFMSILMLTAILSVILCNILTYTAGSTGTAISVTLVEWFLAISMWSFVLKKRLMY